MASVPTSVEVVWPGSVCCDHHLVDRDQVPEHYILPLRVARGQFGKLHLAGQLRLQSVLRTWFARRPDEVYYAKIPAIISNASQP